ncbi:DUF1697 domain-containing protein [Phenylobacterium sp. J426]|uniref:DUF1697 domain-containing protein n=1 Tax=Phenylobacterium sp. J426 TaxID=2898439 RepID=UPI00215130C7|nr:DUF1697 domain-containing protein [Phenylobacterium sp. J426]MCR5875025.1 DUF1697 domain-containing protein [Phenylobacterium sp. J426]
MRRLAILLRAVNVGGIQLKMADFKAVLAAEGFEAPETLLASGNAVVATNARADAVEAQIAAALTAKLGLSTDVFARDRAELEAVIAANPFTAFAAEQPSRMMAVFLKAEPPKDLDPLRRHAVFGEEIAPGPGCLYITYPDGAGRSKLAGAKALTGIGTSRNWNTVRRLAEKLA